MTYVGKKPADIIATAVDTTTGTFSGDLTVDTNTLFVDSANNRVGVGTVSPSQSLHVKGNLDVEGDTSGVSKIRFKAEETHGEVEGINIGNNFGGLAFKTNSNGSVAERMRIDSSGNVGIGTTSPNRMLTLENGDIQIHDTSTGDPLLNFSVGGTQASPTQSWTFRIDNSDSDKFQLMDVTDSRIVLTADGSGNVGIGTSSPATKLDIIFDADSGIKFDTISGAAGTLITSYHGTNNSNVRTLEINCQNFQVETGDPAGTATTERMRIDSSGNFMVSTTNNTLYDDTSGSGLCYRPQLSLDIARQATTSANYMLSLNNTGVDAKFINFAKDGSGVGSIGTNGARLHIASNGNSGLRFRDDLSAILPCNADGSNSDGDQNLGASTVRFKTLFLSEGIRLGGTGTANELDDYEEGSFTPRIRDNPGGGSSQPLDYGRYTKVGNMVTVWIRSDNISLAGLNSASAFYVSGLPFTSTSNGTEAVGSIWWQHLNISATGVVVPRLNGSLTVLRFDELVDNTTDSGKLVSALTTGVSDIRVTLTYEV